MTPAPPGYEWCWQPEAATWQTLPEGVESRPCRYGAGGGHASCGRPSVWRMNRASSRDYPVWWHYCGEHVYGRRIVSGVLLVAVLRAVA